MVQLGHQRGEELARVCAGEDVPAEVLAQLVGVDIAADDELRGILIADPDRGLGADESAPQIGVSQFGTEDDEDVGGSGLGLDTGEADIGAQRQRVGLRDDALAVGCCGHRCVKSLGECPDLGTCPPGTTTGDDERASGAGHRLGGTGDDTRIKTGTASGNRGRHAAVPGALEHVEGNLDVNGPGPRRGEHGERLGDGLCSTFGGARALGGDQQAVQCARGVLRLVQHSDIGALHPGGNTGGENEHRT